MSKYHFNPAPLRAEIAFIALAMAALWAAPRALAQANSNPPERMTYQGFLADGNGNPLGNTNTGPKNYDVIFRIWPDPNAGGSSLWTEQQTVTVDRGYFSVLLGEGTAVAPELHNNLSTLFTNSTASDRYVEMTVKGIGSGGANVTIQPRLRLLTSPYSYLATLATKAVSATSVDGGGVTSGTLADARLSANVALRAGGNSFTGNQIINGGNVGIGNASPADAIQIGDFSGADRYISLKSAGGNLYRTGVKFRHFNDTLGFNIEDYEGTPNGLNFLRYPGGAPVSVMFMDRYSGNIGIGTTSPGYKLDITDRIRLSDGGAGTAGLWLRQGSTDRAFTGLYNNDYWGVFGNGGTGWSLMMNVNNGNVGVGTVAPAAKLDVNGDLKVASGITTGTGANALPGHAPVIIEEKSPNDQTLWNPHVFDISTFANRPGGFKMRIYAQHEQAAGGYEVRNYEATIVQEKVGYANDPDFATKYTRISLSWTGNMGRQSLILGYMDANGCNCSFAQEAFIDGWFKVTNYQVNNSGACGSGAFCMGRTQLCVTFHPAVGGQIVLSDN